MTHDNQRCIHCTIPVDGGELCQWCRAYSPLGDRQPDAVADLADAAKYATYGSENIDDVIRELPSDVPLFAVVDLVRARRHLLLAAHLITGAAEAVTKPEAVTR